MARGRGRGRGARLSESIFNSPTGGLPQRWRGGGSEGSPIISGRGGPRGGWRGGNRGAGSSQAGRQQTRGAAGVSAATSSGAQPKNPTWSDESGLTSEESLRKFRPVDISCRCS